MDNLTLPPNDRSDDPLWYYLAEFSLSEFLSDHDRRDELAAGLLFQAVRELSMPPECVENIEMTLAEFAREALEHFKQGGLEISGRICVFCQKKVITNGGWGYFLIERGSSSSPGSTRLSRNSVDLYLYEEGEDYSSAHSIT